MVNGLIGHTGFVGSNLAAQARFDECYNSKNIEEIRGRSFDLLVCCGARAEKWIANAHPGDDRAGIARLIEALSTVTARQVVLISTVDVYERPVLVDEDSPGCGLHCGAYGQHRFELETFVRSQFDSLVIRLPGLFGPGLKKNIIYDFLHNNQTDRVHRASVYQFYDLQRLWSDLEICREAGLSLVNFATQPVSVAEVAERAFGFRFTNVPDTPAARYDFRTKHDRLFGGFSGYLYGREEVFRRMQSFVDTQRKRAA